MATLHLLHRVVDGLEHTRHTLVAPLAPFVLAAAIPPGCLAARCAAANAVGSDEFYCCDPAPGARGPRGAAACWAARVWWRLCVCEDAQQLAPRFTESA